MKKKAITIAIAAIVVASAVLGVAGCGTNKGSALESIDNPFVENFTEMDYSQGYTKVEGLDAMEVLISTVTVFDYEPADYTITDAEKLNLA